MIFQGTNPPLSASGVILVSSFVKMDPATKYCVLQCTGPADLPIGVSQQGSWQTPGVPGTSTSTCTPPASSTTPPAPSSSTPFQITVYGIGSVVRLQISASATASIVPGTLIASFTDGTGMAYNDPAIASLEQNYAGAIALTTGSAGQFIRVLVIAPFPLSQKGTSLIRVSLTPSVVGAFNTTDQTFSIAGFTGAPNDPVVVAGEALTAGIGIVNAIALSAGSLKIRFANVTSVSLTPAAQFFDIVTVG